MNETNAIVDALKTLLRSQKITYARVAEHLELSEASVKRLFASCSFTLDRLESVCALAGVRVSDLTRMADQKPAAITRLTEEQEVLLVSDPGLLLVAMLTLNHWPVADIVDTYSLNENDVVGKLLQLDRMGMIELQPGNRVRRLVARHFAWRPDGPVQRYFEERLKGDFLESRFDAPGEHMRFLGGNISRESLSRMHQGIDKLVQDLDTYIQQDADLPREEKRGVAAVFAIRPWEVPAFRKLRIKPREPMKP